MLIEQVYRDRYDDLKRVVKKYVNNEEDADDITQDAFIRAWSSVDSFRGDSELFTWLTRIAMNLAFDKRRENKLPTTQLKILDGEEILPSAYRDVSCPEKLLIAHERELDMVEKLAKLDNKYKLPLILCDYHELSYQEIADELGIPVNTVRSRIHRARKALKGITQAD